MMQFNYKKTRNFVITGLWLICWSCSVFSQSVTLDDCRPLQPASSKLNKTLAYSDALLWEIRKGNSKPSYIFGTMHVSDPRITVLPEIINEKLNNAEIFVMEALPEPEESMKLAQMMFFDDGTTLMDYVDENFFKQMVEILGMYQLPSEAVTFIKPWAAFLIMNYPAEQGLALDLQLFNIAQQNGIRLEGLETLTEQGDLFSNIKIDDQVRLLLDTVCNYDTLSDDYEKMKTYYLNRDLQGLVTYSNKYSFSEEKIYKDLIKKLLPDRNITMVDKMQSILKSGNAFIAIGAMHLPGKDGVLSLLEKQGYKISSVY